VVQPEDDEPSALPMGDPSALRTRALRALPIVQGLEHLVFRCTGCGNCCKTLRVAVTARDLGRLVRATAEPCAELVEWLAPDTVDMSGEPASFVELPAGRRLMVLAQRAGGGACRWLDSSERCSVYAARPYDCRLYPFHLDRLLERADVASLSLLSFTDCDHERDGETDVDALLQDDSARSRELAEYQRVVARWNHLQRHRRRLRHPLGSAADFFAFCGL
jgi:Fe-S-cluster containining protein